MIFLVITMTTNTYKTEKDLNGFEIYSWFSKDYAYERVGYIPNIRVCSKSSVPNVDRDRFRAECARLIKLLFNNTKALYLVRFVLTQTELTRVEKSKGVWGFLRTTSKQELIFGEEIEFKTKNTLIRTGAAKINNIGVLKSISVLEKDPLSNFIISSNTELTKNDLVGLTNEFANSEKKLLIFPLIIHVLQNFEGLIRFGDSGEEVCIDYIYTKPKSEPATLKN
ncbi:hypothetical protein LEP1GSC005_1846 [Leptospira santarosai str. ST188]|nr:hypothetical protein LEP1GSC005_1846 [Leptospira santarosai str. ST188]